MKSSCGFVFLCFYLLTAKRVSAQDDLAGSFFSGKIGTVQDSDHIMWPIDTLQCFCHLLLSWNWNLKSIVKSMRKELWNNAVNCCHQRDYKLTESECYYCLYVFRRNGIFWNRSKKRISTASFVSLPTLHTLSYVSSKQLFGRIELLGCSYWKLEIVWIFSDFTFLSLFHSLFVYNRSLELFFVFFDRRVIDDDTQIETEREKVERKMKRHVNCFEFWKNFNV